jgi:hypothetical protein
VNIQNNSITPEQLPFPEMNVSGIPALKRRSPERLFVNQNGRGHIFNLLVEKPTRTPLREVKHR